MKVKMPFLQRFKEPLLNGTKIWTSRSKIMGKPGDTFDAFGAEFLITSVSTCIPLHEVAEHWIEEGCSSFDDFVRVWEQIHPRKGFDPDTEVVTHTFRLVSSKEKGENKQ
jgi:hypothetical protein